MKKISLILIGSGLFFTACKSKKVMAETKPATTEKTIVQASTVKPKEEIKTQTVNKNNTMELASGLKIDFTERGNGATPKAGDIVVAHYTGYLTDGTKFDSSKDRNQPFQFPLGQGKVIKGWDEGFANMKVGDKAKLTIPPTLGYGERGAGASIPPNAILIFDVELLDIKAGPKPQVVWDYKSKQVQTTASGLKYYIIEQGAGATPKAGTNVSVHYSGFLADGTKFDSSVERGEPIKFAVGQGMVIKGWDEGIMLLQKGSKAVLEIPSELGYGANGAGGVIPPNAKLFFNVEIVDF